MPNLRQVLEQEFGDLAKLSLKSGDLDAHVSEIFLSTGAPCSSHAGVFKQWPGMESDVYRWFVLPDGMAVGVRGKPGEPLTVTKYPWKKMNHIDWNRLRTFQVVEQCGSFTKAGLELDLTQSAVSRQIAALEHDLGSALFIRTSSGLVLTEAGEYFLETVQRMWENLELGLARLNEMRDVPNGPLRLTTTVGFGSAWLTSRINKFHEMYPDIQISLLLVDDAELDLRRREADCAVRFQMPTEPSLVQKYIADFSYHIYGCKNYLAARGTPRSLGDLDDHDLIVYGDGVGHPPIEDINWLLRAGIPEGLTREPALFVNSVYGIYRAVESGMGLAALPFYMSERSDKLLEVLPDVEGPRIPVYFVYPEELRPSRRIEVLRDFLIQEIRLSWQNKSGPAPADAPAPGA